MLPPRPFRLLCLTFFCAAVALIGFHPAQAQATPVAAVLAAGPLPLRAEPPAAVAPRSDMALAMAALSAVPQLSAQKAMPHSDGAALAFLAALAPAPEAAPAWRPALLAAPAHIAPVRDETLPEAVVIALEAVRLEEAPALAARDEEPAPLLAKAPPEAVRQEETAEAGVLSLAELEAHAGGTGINVGVLTNQILTGVSSGNTINAGQVGSGGITIETDAFSGYDGIGNFMINSGHNNVLQSSVNVTIVMTPP